MSSETLKHNSTLDIEETLREITTDDDQHDLAIRRAADLCKAVRESLEEERSKVLKSLLASDDFTLSFKAEKSGNIVVRSLTFTENAVVLPGEVLQVAMDGGRCVVTRRKM